MRRYRKIGIAGRFCRSVPLNQSGRGDGDDLNTESLGATFRISIDCGIGIIAAGFRNDQFARPNKPRQIIDMAIGMIVDQPITQPQNPIKAEVVMQGLFDLFPRQIWVAIGVEQTLLGRDDKAGSIAINSSSFEHIVCPFYGEVCRLG